MPFKIPPEVLRMIAEWSKDLPQGDAVNQAMQTGILRTHDTGLEHMVHQAAPPSPNPTMLTGNANSVGFHPDMRDPQAWLGGQYPSDYIFHTHPLSVVHQGAPFGIPGEMRGAALSEGYAPFEAPWFSSPDLDIFAKGLSRRQPQNDVRWALATPEGSFLSAQLRPRPGGGPSPYHGTFNAYANMANDALERLGPEGIATWSQRMNQEYGHPGLLGNVAATAPMFKTQGDLFDLQSHFSDPRFQDVIDEYIRSTHMRDGGRFYEQVLDA